MPDLKSQIIRLAYTHSNFRPVLLPLLRQGSLTPALERAMYRDLSGALHKLRASFIDDDESYIDSGKDSTGLWFRFVIVGDARVVAKYLRDNKQYNSAIIDAEEADDELVVWLDPAYHSAP